MTATVDVLIVGAGPVGLTAALALERMGVSVAIVEQRDGPQRAPAAHVISARTFEIWRQLGLDVDGLRADAQDPADAGFVHWVTKLGGDVIGSLPFERQGDDVLALTPTPLRNLSQHRIEPRLVGELAARGVPVQYSHTWRSSEQGEGRVVSTLTRPDGTHTVSSRYLLACDGASSAIRRAAGIVPEGPHQLQSFVMVHLAAGFRSIAGSPPGVLYWVCAPGVGGTFVSHGIDSEWVYMYPFDREQESDESFTPERAATLVRAALADPATPFDVIAVSTWTMSAQIAPQFRTGRVFLVGDAAHRFPPTGGLGLNTGVQDAHNLAWKLAAVLRGEADDALLDTYETERRPVAQRNADVSLANAMKLIEVPVALGADPDATLRVPAGRAEVLRAIERQRTHFDMLGLQLGYCYGASAPTDETVSNYVPAAVPGARLPHGWITRAGVRCSTLDLVPLDQPLKIGGPAVAECDADLRVGIDFDDPDGWWSDVVGLPATGVLVVRPDQHVAERRAAPVSASSEV